MLLHKLGVALMISVRFFRSNFPVYPRPYEHSPTNCPKYFLDVFSSGLSLWSTIVAFECLKLFPANDWQHANQISKALPASPSPFKQCLYSPSYINHSIITTTKTRSTQCPKTSTIPSYPKWLPPLFPSNVYSNITYTIRPRKSGKSPTHTLSLTDAFHNTIKPNVQKAPLPWNSRL